MGTGGFFMAAQRIAWPRLRHPSDRSESSSIPTWWVSALSTRTSKRAPRHQKRNPAGRCRHSAR
eukprot:216531-Rhodomonas_salina.4